MTIRGYAAASGIMVGGVWLHIGERSIDVVETYISIVGAVSKQNKKTLADNDASSSSYK